MNPKRKHVPVICKNFYSPNRILSIKRKRKKILFNKNSSLVKQITVALKHAYILTNTLHSILRMLTIVSQLFGILKATLFVNRKILKTLICTKPRQSRKVNTPEGEEKGKSKVLQCLKLYFSRECRLRYRQNPQGSPYNAYHVI